MGNDRKVIDLIERHTLLGDALASRLADVLGFELNRYETIDQWTSKTNETSPGLPDLLLVIDTDNDDLEGIAGSVAALKDAHNNLKIMVVGASAAATEIMPILEAGASGYLPTSASLPILIETVRLILAGGTYAPVDTLLSASRIGHDPSERRPMPRPACANHALTTRQIEVLRLLCEGKSNKLIAYELEMSEGTVKVHVRNLMRKLSASNRTQVAIMGNHLVEATAP